MNYGLNEKEKRILTLLKDNGPMDAGSIHMLTQVKKWQVYAALSKLEERGFASSFPLERMKGATSVKLYRLSAKGARSVGLDEVPKSHYRFLRADFYAHRMIQAYIKSLAHVFDDNESARDALASFLSRKGGNTTPDYLFLEALPEKVSPDLVIKTKRGVLVVIIPYPTAGRDAFNERLEKWKGVIYDLSFLFICPLEKQKEQFFSVLEGRPYRKNFTVLSISGIGQIKHLFF
jgi:DNA-binding PadR family transcriptional regulator